MEEELRGAPDAEAAARLYEPPVSHEKIQGAKIFNTYCIRIEGATVRYEEDLQGIEVTFEGGLPQKVINAGVKDLQAKLTRLKRKPCTAKRNLLQT